MQLTDERHSTHYGEVQCTTYCWTKLTKQITSMGWHANMMTFIIWCNWTLQNPKVLFIYCVLSYLVFFFSGLGALYPMHQVDDQTWLWVHVYALFSLVLLSFSVSCSLQAQHFASPAAVKCLTEKNDTRQYRRYNKTSGCFKVKNGNSAPPTPETTEGPHARAHSTSRQGAEHTVLG